MFPIPSFLKKKKEYKYQNEILSHSTPIKIILDVDIEGKSEKIPLTSSVLYVAPDDSSDYFTKLYDDYFNKPKEQQSNTENQPTATTTNQPTEEQMMQNQENIEMKFGGAEDIPDVPLETYPRLPIRKLKLPVHKLKQLKYKEIVQFFFNKDVFAKKMEQWNSDTLMNRIGNQIDSFYKELVNDKDDDTHENAQSSQTTPKAKKEEEEEKPETEEETYDTEERMIYLLSKEEVDNIEIEKENIEIMLRLLFPTYYFYSEGYKTSMQYWNISEPYMRNIIPKMRFSYIRHNGKIYTITNAVWLNDVFNVPFYRELIRYYEKYKDWKTGMILKLQNKVNRNQRIIDKSKKIGTPLPDKKAMESEIDIVKRVILLLEKNILSRTEYEQLFHQSNSEYSKIYASDLKSSIDNKTKNQLYFYNLIFAKENERILSYSNHRLNDMIYENYSYPITKMKSITDKQLLEIMLENIIHYAKNKGDIGYLKNKLCTTKDKTVCRPRDEISTFYYAGILYNKKNSTDEPSYEMYLLMDVIEGEVNKHNLAGIKCKYENQSIGKKIELFTGKWNAWDLSNRRIFLKLITDSDAPLVSNTISEEPNVSSVSQYSRDDEIRDAQKTLNSNIQTRILSMAEYDREQTTPKLKNALNTLKEKVENFPEKNERYMQNVKPLTWSLGDNQTDTFLKWLKNENKYPTPSSSDKNNDKYTAIDKQIYSLLEKTEKIAQSSRTSKKSTELAQVIDEIYLIQSTIQANIDNNRGKNEPRLDYINYILEFYVHFCIFLKSYWENQSQSLQQGGSGSKGAVEDLNEMYSRIFHHHPHAKTQKHSLDKKRGTRKNH